MKRPSLFLALGATLIMVVACTPTGRTRTASQLLRDVAPSVVRVYNADGEGTGFVAFEVGSVLTAFHVVGNLDSTLTVVAADGTEYRAMVLGADEASDLALLSVPGLKASPLPLGATVATGDTVYAVGYPAGLAGEASVTQGIISAQRREGDLEVAYLQTDAPINPGNSGGPLFNTLGEVIGVNVAVLRGEAGEFEGMGFALSTLDIDSVFEAMRAGTVRLLPVTTPTPGTAMSMVGGFPEGWLEYQYSGEAGLLSLWHPPSWELSSEYPPVLIFGIGKGSSVVSEKAIASLMFEPRPADCAAWMRPDECVRSSFEALFAAVAAAGGRLGAAGDSFSNTGSYIGPWGTVYVFEFRQTIAGDSKDVTMVQARYYRGLSDGTLMRLGYIRFDNVTVTAAEHAIIRQVFDSIRVTEQ